MKKLIRLTESDLHRIVKESIKIILGEQSDRFETYYRGYNSKYGSQRDHMLWITDDISYARTYGNRVEEITIDLKKLNLASLYTIDDILGYEFDYIDGLDEEESEMVLSQGYNGYEFEANSNNSDCICLLSSEPIVSRRELSRGEFDAIELYDGFDHKQYDDIYDRR